MRREDLFLKERIKIKKGKKDHLVMLTSPIHKPLVSNVKNQDFSNWIA